MWHSECFASVCNCEGSFAYSYMDMCWSSVLSWSPQQLAAAFHVGPPAKHAVCDGSLGQCTTLQHMALTTE
jgi:hypothetical protein